jgi:hypothetical protein
MLDRGILPQDLHPPSNHPSFLCESHPFRRLALIQDRFPRGDLFHHLLAYKSPPTLKNGVARRAERIDQRSWRCASIVRPPFPLKREGEGFRRRPPCNHTDLSPPTTESSPATKDSATTPAPWQATTACSKHRTVGTSSIKWGRSAEVISIRSIASVWHRTKTSPSTGHWTLT